MPAAPPPYSRPVELTSAPQQGKEVLLSPDAEERARIATWLGALELPAFAATVRLARLDDDNYGYEAEFTAEVVQACAVSLEPVPSLHSGSFARRYRVVARSPSRRAKRDVQVDIASEDESPEILESSVLDIAAPVLEELSLGLDPYPRAPGVRFEPPAEEGKGADNPFAVLAKLKHGRGGAREPDK